VRVSNLQNKFRFSKGVSAISDVFDHFIRYLSLAQYI
jgi:hypothetical protein